VRTYSSGMYARLAFAVATHVDPEILIIDEILSVGDEHFARKSSAKMEEFHRAGKTILLVTHDLATLQRRCDEAAWLDAGVLRAAGDPTEVVAAYRRAVAEAEVIATEQHAPRVYAPVQPRSGPPAEPGRRWGSFEGELNAVEIRGADGPRHVFSPDDPFALTVDFIRYAPLIKPQLEVKIRTEGEGLVWATSESLPEGQAGQLRLELPRLGLGDGNYLVDLVLSGDSGSVLYDVHRGLHGFAVRATPSSGMLAPVHRWSIESPPA
jgi:lipopolysaccharide transport system ATP-binding protein